MSSLLKDRCLVNGEWVAAASGNTFDVVNPVNGKVIGPLDEEETFGADDFNLLEKLMGQKSLVASILVRRSRVPSIV